MKPEELLQTLRDAEMDDEAIKALLGEALKALEGAPAEEPAEPAAEEADEDKKFNDFYGF